MHCDVREHEPLHLPVPAPPEPIAERGMPRSAAASWLRRGGGQLAVQPCPLCSRVNTR